MPKISIPMEPLFQKIGRTPLNIAPERGKELKNEIFQNSKWTLVAERGDPKTHAHAKFAAEATSDVVSLLLLVSFGSLSPFDHAWHK